MHQGRLSNSSWTALRRFRNGALNDIKRELRSGEVNLNLATNTTTKNPEFSAYVSNRIIQPSSASYRVIT